jgi:hypothetical protein
VKDHAAWAVMSVKIGGGHSVMHGRYHCFKSSSDSKGDFLFINLLFSLVEGLLSPVRFLFVFHSHMQEHPRN